MIASTTQAGESALKRSIVMQQSQSWNTHDIARIETIYHNANGYLGVRCSPEEGSLPGSIRGTYLNGFYEILDITYGEKLYGFPETKQTIVNVPDAQTIRLSLNHQPVSLYASGTDNRCVTLDMENGITRRTCTVYTGTGDVQITVTRLASLAYPNLFLMCYQVASETYTGPVSLCSTLRADVTNFADASDPRVAAEPLRALVTDSLSADAQQAIAVCHTKRSGLSLACLVHHDCTLSGNWTCADGEAAQTLEGSLKPGETVTLTKWVVYADSLRCPDPRQAVMECFREVHTLGAEAIMHKQHENAQKLLKHTFASVQAPGHLPDAFAFDQWELVQSTARDGIASVAAKGLSGEGYEGHIFWDSEIYVFPFFLWTQPDQARSMLSCRFTMLPRARQIARTLGLSRGALFPWRTMNGDECSAFFPAGTAQYHINGDIAYAVIQYLSVTDDWAFMAEQGAEILIETARMWLELGHMADDGFRIDCVTGPDEYTCLVNNNFYTNAVAQYNLRGAAEVIRGLRARGLADAVTARTGLQDEEILQMEQAAQRMYFPTAPELGISPQDDSFLQKKDLDWKSFPKSDFPLLLHYHPLFLYRHKVCKQADTILAHLMFPETTDRETARRSFAYYDSITTHDSSLSECVYAMQAVRLGDLARGAHGFEQTALLDIDDSHGNTKDGLHTASLGGAYLTVLRGFAGIRSEHGELSADPVLPDDWEGYRLPFRFHGRELLLTCSREHGAQLMLQSGEPLDVRFCGSHITLTQTM